MFEDIITAISESLKLDKSLIQNVLVRSDDIKRADYALPCFSLAKIIKTSPVELANRIKNEIQLPSSIERMEVVGPYLNFFVKRSDLAKQTIQDILSNTEKPHSVSKKETIIVEYSSPNIAKNLHVGHMRTTLIGLSLERIYKYLGYNVITINHLGDWGVQFGYIWAACEIWGTPSNANIDSLVELYVKANILKKDQEDGKVQDADKDKPDISAMARDYFIRLEDGDPKAIQFWQWCLDLSLEDFKKTYSRLNIAFDHYTGESFYRDQISIVEHIVRESGILQESRGALGVDLGKELGFARIFAEDGRSLYITRDIAQAMYRDKTYRPDKILYVVAAQQSLHFKQFIEIMRRMKHPVADKMVHVSFGFVPGMKTRDGSAILLKDFLSEAHKLALKTYRQEVAKRPEGTNEEEIAEQVAIGATYFYFLKHTNIKDFNFSWEEALNFHGDSGAYVQYALARLYSIESKAKENGLDTSMPALQNLNSNLLAENEAHALIVHLSLFQENVQKAADDYEPSHLAMYALELAKKVSAAYRALRVVGEEIELAQARLALFMACREVLRNALFLVGVPTIKQM
jgi:arginyl-tRNA synthetase